LVRVLGGASFSGMMGERPTSITELRGAPLGFEALGSAARIWLATSLQNSDGLLVGFFAVNERNLFWGFIRVGLPRELCREFALGLF
jgi:hypothetical protein